MNSQVVVSNECQICNINDGVKIGWYYGAVVCEACKKFFMRGEKNDVHLKFKCTNKQNCQVSVTNRSQCQYCRYKKCKQIGMDLKCKYIYFIILL